MFFVRPDNNVVVETLDGSSHYPPITALEYTKHRFSATYDLKNWSGKNGGKYQELLLGTAVVLRGEEMKESAHSMSNSISTP